jgi:hypothetical protein
MALPFSHAQSDQVIDSTHTLDSLAVKQPKAELDILEEIIEDSLATSDSSDLTENAFEKIITFLRDFTGIRDTLRYFFSAIFQGFAALIALGAMFFFYFRQSVEREMDNLKNEMRNYFNINLPKIRAEIDIEGIVLYVKKYLKSKKGSEDYNIKILSKHLNRYDYLDETMSGFTIKIPEILNMTIQILIISMIGLFFVGYSVIIDSILVIIGAYLIIISIKNLFTIESFIVRILGGKSLLNLSKKLLLRKYDKRVE